MFDITNIYIYKLEQVLKIHITCYHSHVFQWKHLADTGHKSQPI